jgi:FixJ family two-component response regulator/signal transduction histidine kinase
MRWRTAADAKGIEGPDGEARTMARPRKTVSAREPGRRYKAQDMSLRPTNAASRSIPETVQRLILQTYAPAAAVVDRQLFPVYFVGAADRYLQVVAGEPSQDILNIAREGLRPKLRETIARAFRLNRRISAHGVWLNRDDRTVPVTIEAQPIVHEHGDLLLVSFVDETPRPRRNVLTAADADSSELSELREQLTDTRKELNRTVVELREANEELRAMDEEAHSPNEVVRSANHEFESFTQELRSSNGALGAVSGRRQNPDVPRRAKQDEERLLQAKAEADRANEAKSRFLLAASHDLRQPLQVVSLVHGLLAKRVSDPETRTALARMDDAVLYMGELLDSLLDVGQIESGAIKPELADVQLAQLLSRKADEFGPAAQDKGVALRLVPSSAIVRSDPRLLRRMLRNLISNAVKYTDRGKVLLGCRRMGDSLRIEVWDSGAGIPEESLEAIFQEFHRVGEAGGGKPGMGLGLYIVQRFALALGHRVEVRSTPGKGSMFAIVIDGARYGETPAVGRAVGRAPAEPSVLLIEDDPSQLESLRLLLEQDGYRVTTARNGEEALDWMRSPAAMGPDVIIADQRLAGGLTGLEIIKQARGELDPDIPALVVCGDRLSAELAGQGMSRLLFVAKPVKAGELLAAASAMTRITRPGWTARRRIVVAPEPVAAPEADVGVIDDEPAVRDAIATALEAEGHSVATYASAEAFLADKERARPGCLVIDVNLPNVNGLQLQKQLNDKASRIPIVFITGRGELEMAVEAMRGGAVDFLQKPVRAETLRDSVARALHLSHQGPAQSRERRDAVERLAGLTAREREVMDLILAGGMNKQIASQLGISQRTAEHHRQSLMRKIGVKSLAMLVQKVGLANLRE